MFRKLQPENRFNCKCHNEQFHFSSKDDLIKKTEQVEIIQQIQVVLVVANPFVKDKSK